MTTKKTQTNPNEQRVTGRDAVLKFQPDEEKNYYEVPVTNISWSRDVSTTESQDNQDLNAVMAVTGLRYSGSFELDGQNRTIEQKLFHETGYADVNEYKNAAARGTITVREKRGASDGSTKTVKYTFKEVLVTSQSRDLPSDDISSASFDFSAEKLDIS